MRIINAFEPDFKLIENNQYELYIEGNNQLLQFTIFDNNKNQFLGVRQYISETSDKPAELINEILNDEVIGNAYFQRIVFAYSSYRAMLVPHSLFDAEHLEDFLKFHHKIEEEEKIYYHFISKADAFIIYSCPAYFESSIKHKFAQADFRHHAIPFINTALEKNIESNLPAVYIFLGYNFFDMLVMKQGKILLFNSFFYQKHTDVLYFMVNIANLFSIPPHHSHLYITGNLDPIGYNNVVNELKTLFPFIVSDDNLPDNFQYAKEILALPPYQLQTLLRLKQCG